MGIDIREFDQMINDTLLRITDNTNITNINSGSVIRTIVESVLAESDVQYYQLFKIFRAMGLDDAVGEDLERLVSILSITRKHATACVWSLEFGRTEPFNTDIAIEYGNIVSTLPDRDGKIIEFMVTQNNAVLPAGELTVNVICTAVVAGSIYVPRNTLTIMNTPILNIAYVINNEDIYGGTNAETDDDLRERARDALMLLGRGTLGAIEAAIKNVSGVVDCIPIDMPRGPGTVDVVTITGTLPPPMDLDWDIHEALRETKAGGIKADIVYPTVRPIDIEVNTSVDIDGETVRDAILAYINTLHVAETFVVNQMERYVLNVIESKGYRNADVGAILPDSNIEPYGTQIIRAGTITVNGVVVL